MPSSNGSVGMFILNGNPETISLSGIENGVQNMASQTSLSYE